MTAAGNALRWLLASGSPGEIGDPEVWVDEAAFRSVAPRYGRDVVGMTDAVVRFPGATGTAPVYKIISRRWSAFNLGRPYFVLREGEGLHD